MNACGVGLVPAVMPVEGHQRNRKQQREHGTDMKREASVYKATVVVGAVALFTLLMPPMSAQSDVGRTVAAKLDITLIQPVAVTTGNNRFELIIEDADQHAIDDVDVTVEFVKSAWPIKRIPEIRNNLTMGSAGDGRYRATRNVSQPGPWVATVIAKKDRKIIGRRRFVLVAY